MKTTIDRYLEMYPYSASLLAGFCMGLPFLHPLLWWCWFVGMVLLICIVTNAHSYRSVLLSGLWAGTVKLLLVQVWVFAAYPFDWLHVDSDVLQIIFITVVWLSASFVVGIGTACCAVLMYESQKSGLRVGLLLMPAWLVLGEVFGSILFSLAFFGPGSAITAQYSFGYSGYVLADYIGIRDVAVLGGVYALTVVAGVIGVLMYYGLHYFSRTLQMKKKLVIGMSLVLFVCIGYAPPGAFAQPVRVADNTGERVAVITTLFDQYFKVNPLLQRIRLDMLESAVRSALQGGADIIVLPEGAHFDERFSDTTDVFTYLRTYSTHTVVLIDSSEEVTQAGNKLVQARIYDTASDEVYIFEKQYLVPFGESVPYGMSYAIGFVGLRPIVEHALEQIRFVPGTDQRLVTMPDHVPRVLFCFESVAPIGVRSTYERQVPQLMAHLVSHSWFNRMPKILWHQLDAMLKVQALWNNTTIAVAANMAPSGVYTPQGIHIPFDATTGVAQDRLWRVDMISIE